ncbi:hypothetical protein D3C86_1871800 [compost metagenome]
MAKPRRKEWLVYCSAAIPARSSAWRNNGITLLACNPSSLKLPQRSIARNTGPRTNAAALIQSMYACTGHNRCKAGV